MAQLDPVDLTAFDSWGHQNLVYAVYCGWNRSTVQVRVECQVRDGRLGKTDGIGPPEEHAKADAAASA